MDGSESPESGSRLVHVGVQQDRIDRPNPRVALLLAVGVGIVVFILFLAMRRTFGVKH